MVRTVSRRPGLLAYVSLAFSVLFCSVHGIHAAQADKPESYSHEIELSLNSIFQDISTFDLQGASEKTELLTQTYPDFALGQLLHAEFMMAKGLSSTLIDSDQPFSPRMLELMMEAQSRSRHSTLAVDNTRLPEHLLQIGQDISHIVTVDLEYSRLFLVKNHEQRPRIVAHHYAASGRGGYGKLVEGDLRTPTGVYRVTEFKPGATLPALYGAGALTLDYPNALDRHYKRTGSGIWLHGVPQSNMSRAPRSSEGCVVMPNDLLVDLHNALDLESTLVVLSGELGWQTRQRLRDDSETFVDLFNEWRQALQQNNLAKLKNLHEQPLFQRASVGYTDFPQHPQLLNQLVSVNTEDLTIIRYPDFPDAGSQQSPQVMMQFALPADNPGNDPETQTGSQNPVIGNPGARPRMTLYWALNPANQWQIVKIKQDPHLI